MPHEPSVPDVRSEDKSAVEEAALVYVAAGRSVAPIYPNQKYPQGNAWKAYQTRLPTADEIRRWFRRTPLLGLCIICGKVSGDQECIDFDEMQTYHVFVNLITEIGYAALLERLVIEHTPRPGVHLGYRCEVIEGNRKLARQKMGVLPNGKDDIKTLIETRGEGGLIVAAPTPAGIHPDCPERGYELIQGDWTRPPLITPEEREILWNCARALNRYTPENRSQSYREPSSDTDRVGNDYNAQVSVDDLLELLEGEDWQKTYSQGDGHYLRRPGKTRGNWSATLNICGPKRFYVFSSSVEHFDNDRSYDPFGVYMRLKHNGDGKAAAKALAEQGYGRNGQPSTHTHKAQDDGHHRGDNSDEQDVSQGNMTLEQVIETFRDWLDLPDAGFIEVLLATYAANQIPGDPVWLLAVGPSSGGKTEPLQAMLGLPHTKLASTLTESALLSGTPKRDKDKASTGGLLREIGDFGYLILKDFTSVLAMQDKIRMTTVAALREIYDQSWARPLGIDGGRVLFWKGKIAILAGCTDVIDSHHTLMTAMGSRFLMYRIPMIDAYAQASKAYDMNARESEMRQKLRQAVSGFLKGRDFSNVRPMTSESIRERLIQLSILAVVARSPIERDRHTREIILIPDPEAPARVTKALGKLHAALVAVGVSGARAWTLVRKIAFDSMPKLRYALIKALAEKSAQRASDLAIAIHHPTQTTKRALEDLVGLKLVEREKITGVRADLWSLTNETSIRLRQLPEIIENEDIDEP